jgi:hypothetical protein
MLYGILTGPMTSPRPGRPSIGAVVKYAERIAARYVAATTPEQSLDTYLHQRLFGRNGNWLVFEHGLVTEREASDLLLNGMINYFRHASTTPHAFTEISGEDVEALDQILFGRSARADPY